MTDQMTTKACPVCGRTLTIGHFAKDRHRRDGHTNRCKDCDNERSKRYYAAHREHKLAKARRKQRETRTCTECGGPATSQRHWFCDTCRSSGARRSQPGATRRQPVPPAHHCANGTMGCLMDHSDPAAPCRDSLPGDVLLEMFNSDPEGIRRWTRGLHPYYGR